jgi:hypothetical protein
VNTVYNIPVFDLVIALAARLSGVENLPVVTFVNTVYNIPVFDLVIALAASGQFEQVGAQ